MKLLSQHAHRKERSSKFNTHRGWPRFLHCFSVCFTGIFNGIFAARARRQQNVQTSNSKSLQIFSLKPKSGLPNFKNESVGSHLISRLGDLSPTICVCGVLGKIQNPLLQAWARRGLNAMGWDFVCAVRPSVESMAFDGVASVEAWIA